MKQEQFEALARQGYNLIPISEQLKTDLDTPVSTYLKLANLPYTYLLESVEGGEKWGRFSIIGLACQSLLEVRYNKVTLTDNGQVIEQKKVSDPLKSIDKFLTRYKVPQLPNLPPFNGGLVGYFGYDTIRYIEPKLKYREDQVDELNAPDILLMLSRDLLVFDNCNNTLTLITHARPDENKAREKAKERLNLWTSQLQSSTLGNYHFARDDQAEDPTKAITESDFKSSFGEQDYKQAVNKIKGYIRAGDCMQVVPSQRMSVPFPNEPFNLYRTLRYLNPSPYMYFLHLKDFHIVGCSPEVLARCEKGKATVRPLAGTRKRGLTAEKDKALEKELLADPKEIAEHLMLIDLGRNDIGRIAKKGSVRVSEQMAIERYSHVMHIVSNVVGEIKPNCSVLDVLRATFPTGTLSGAPKSRAIEIISELEPVKRSIYGGAVGYLDWHNNMQMAIAIRTAIIKDETLYIQVGAGIVADSDPDLEWKETMNKARAIFKAAEITQKNFISS